MKLFHHCWCLLLFLTACAPEPEAINDPNDTSEMALMMRGLYDDMLDLKNELNAGRSLEEARLNFEPIHHHSPTDSSFIKPGFMDHSATFSRAVALFNENPGEDTYRGVMMGCVSCHQALCPGPLVRIDNLILP